MAIVSSITDYLVEVFKMYIITFYIFHCTSQKYSRKLLILCSGCICCIFIGFLIPNASLQTQVMGIIMLLSVIVMLKKMKEFPIPIIAFMILNIIDYLISNVYLYISNIPIDTLLDDWLTCQLLNIAVVPFLFLISQHHCFKNARKRSSEEEYSRYYLHNSLLVATFLFFSAYCAVAVQEYYNKLAAILVIVFFFLLFFIICIYNLFYQEKNRTKLSFYSHFLAAQAQYYDAMLKRDSEIRSFRHDIKSHLYCIEILIQQNRQQEALDYIHSLDDFVRSGELQKITGNSFLDIVVNDVFLGQDDIKLVWKGHFPTQTVISNTDLCILYSNLLKNAVEAAQQAALSAKVITVDITVFQSNLFTKITNPCVQAPNIHKGKLMTTKGNITEHGIGMQNVQEVVRKYSGSIQCHYKDHIFTTELFFNSIISAKSEN